MFNKKKKVSHYSRGCPIMISNNLIYVFFLYKTLIENVTNLNFWIFVKQR